MRRRRVLLLVAVVLAGLAGWFVVVGWRRAAPLNRQDAIQALEATQGYDPHDLNVLVATVGHWEYRALVPHGSTPFSHIREYGSVERHPLTLMARLRDWWEGE